jgi:hypothetical protein
LLKGVAVTFLDACGTVDVSRTLRAELVAAGGADLQDRVMSPAPLRLLISLRIATVGAALAGSFLK